MRSHLPDYDLVTATDLAQALRVLASGDGWRPIAGGTDLMVLFNAGRLPYRRLVSVAKLPELPRSPPLPKQSQSARLLLIQPSNAILFYRLSFRCCAKPLAGPAA